MKVVVGTVVAVVLAGVGAAVAYVTLFGGPELRHPTQTALRAAMPATAAAELQARGHALSAPLNCRDLPGWTKQSLRVQCAGTTKADKDVQVIGSGEAESAKEYYTILVDGRPLVQNAICLGTDCRKKS